MLRTNIPEINCAPRWLYLQDCAGMHGQQNIKNSLTLHLKSHKIPGSSVSYRVRTFACGMNFE